MGSNPIVDGPAVVRLVRSPWLWFGSLVALAWVLLMVRHRRSGDHAAHASLGTVVAMWLVMVLAMMAPTAVPVLASLRDIVRNDSTTTWWAFLGGYLVVWSVVAAVMAVAQWWLSSVGLLDPAGASTSYWLTAALLLAAGGYQFSALKHRCQTECERPMTFFWRHWRSGTGGALRMGLRHGAVCVGCCWLLMLLAFVAGVASVWFMLLCAVVMAAEKVPAIGRRISVPLGTALLVAGALMAVAAAAVGDTSSSNYREEHHGTLVDRG
jgi:predicted metal-binding membrane protein